MSPDNLLPAYSFDSPYANSELSGRKSSPDTQNYSTESLIALRYPQTLPALLPAGKRRHLRRQRIDVLLIPDGEGVPGESDIARLVAGFVVGCGVVDDRAFPSFVGQEACGRVPPFYWFGIVVFWNLLL